MKPVSSATPAHGSRSPFWTQLHVRSAALHASIQIRRDMGAVVAEGIAFTLACYEMARNFPPVSGRFFNPLV
jgi:hypothetical protein